MKYYTLLRAVCPRRLTGQPLPNFVCAYVYEQPMQVPEGFAEILRDFTREVLREQPADVDEFGE